MALRKRKILLLGLLAGLLVFPLSAFADSIDPAAYSATVAVGGSTTIHKVVTIEDKPSSGILDVVFLFDTSGSMGGTIGQAKAAAASILTGLAAFGDLSSGVGYYDEPGPGNGYPAAIRQNLSTVTATTIASINAITLSMGGGGGDFPEEGISGLQQVAEGMLWRPGSNRFIFALGDATFKESDGYTLASARAALDASGATFIGIDYGNMTYTAWGGIDPTIFATDSGGSIIESSGLTPAALVADIIAGISSAFEEYNTVTLSDLGTSGVGFSVTAIGGVGGTFTGDYDRSIDRTFEFDVTFTGLTGGVFSFPTLALVDGGAVARELDTITVGPGGPAVPEPGTMLLLGFGLLGIAGVSRRRKVE